MFDKAKEIYQLQKRAKEVQKELKNTEVEATSVDGLVSIVFTADQKIKQVKIDVSLMTADKKSELEEKIVRVTSEGLSRVQAVAAEKTKGLMSDMGINLPGM
jgi:DNA-binding YbaB/EbfC family protein